MRVLIQLSNAFSYMEFVADPEKQSFLVPHSGELFNLFQKQVSTVTCPFMLFSSGAGHKPILTRKKNICIVLLRFIVPS